LLSQAAGSYERAVQLDPNFAIAWARLSRANALIYAAEGVDTTRTDEAKRALENAQRLAPNSAETLFALGYYQYGVLDNFGAAKITLGRVSRMQPRNADVSYALGLITRNQGEWDQSIVCWEQALALDPRNVQTLTAAAVTHTVLRQFPAALKLYDQALDIMPDDPDVKAEKAAIYQARGNLQEAASLLSQINEQTPSMVVFWNKLIQLRLNRNYNELIRFLKARQVQSDDEYTKSLNQVFLAFAQRFAGDTEGAKTSAEQACHILEQLYTDQPGNPGVGAALSLAYAAMGKKDLALKAAERAIVLCPRSKDPYSGPRYEETLGFIQTVFGQNDRAIATLARLLQTPYDSWLYGSPITPALLRLDPFWDPLRGDPAFQKLCEEKQP
jgi:tetratricopeptide (TPR) repeat protein